MFFLERYVFAPFYGSSLVSRLLGAEGQTDATRIERRLAVSRLLLAATCLLTTLFDSPESDAHSILRRLWLLLYISYGVAVWSALRLRPRLGKRSGFAVHALDVALVSIFTVFTRGPNNAFHVLFLFVLLSAAYRWGFRETLATAAASGGLILLANTLYESELHSLLWRPGTALQHTLVMPAVYLFIQGLVAGFLAEQVKKLHTESAAIAHVLGGIQAGAGLTPTVAYVCNEVLRMFGAGEMLIAVQEAETRSLYLWRAVGGNETGCAIDVKDLPADRKDDYFFPAPGLSWCGVRANGARAVDFAFLALSGEGEQVKEGKIALPENFLAQHPCATLLVDSQKEGEDFDVRVFIKDPARETCGLSGLFLLHSLFARVTPAIIDVYLVRKARAAAAAVERASLSRELHDGVIQSLIAIEMRLAVLNKRVLASTDQLRENLGQIQELLRNEIQNLRVLMQRLKHIEFGGREFVQALESVARQCQSETGIATHFESELMSANLSPRACGEVVRILQEALVNVRKHSEAREVHVSFGQNGRGYLLRIQDDGTGFDFAGRLSLEELDALASGPMVLKERVRLLGGNLEIESKPGRGSCLNIYIPLKRHDYRQI